MKYELITYIILRYAFAVMLLCSGVYLVDTHHGWAGLFFICSILFGGFSISEKEK